MHNLDVRKAIENSNFKYWQVANKLKITDGNFSRLLRTELDKENKNKILTHKVNIGFRSEKTMISCFIWKGKLK